MDTNQLAEEVARHVETTHKFMWDLADRLGFISDGLAHRPETHGAALVVDDLLLLLLNRIDAAKEVPGIARELAAQIAFSKEQGVKETVNKIIADAAGQPIDGEVHHA